MRRSDRLAHVMSALEATSPVRAEDIAETLGVTVRTIYRDMDALRAAGVAITGTRGKGYQATHALTLPPVSLSEDELEALHLGLAAVEQMQDPTLAEAATALAERLDALLPAERNRPEDLAAAARLGRGGLGHVAIVRGALRARQKLSLVEAGREHVLRPLSLKHWGRVWSLIGWSETTSEFLHLPLSAVEALAPLPALFVDEPGTNLAAWDANQL